MSEKVCIVCGAPLSGRQTKYCSNKCSQHDYYHKNIDKYRKYQRNYKKKYNKKNKEKIAAYKKEYYKNAKEKRQAYQRARDRGLVDEYKWETEYEKLYFEKPVKVMNDCVYCLYFDSCDKKKECEYR